MSLFNQGWIGLDGDPILGKAPPSLRVHAPQGVQLSPQQYGEIAHAFKLFTDAVRFSAHPDGFHSRDRVLRDGSQVRMTANGGNFEVQAWIGGKSEVSAWWRGIVMKTQTINGAVVSSDPSSPTKATAALLPALIGFIKKRLGADRWAILVKKYRPDKTKNALTYFVDDTRRSWKPTDSVQMDYPYADVYAVSGTKLFKNAQSAGQFPVPVPPEGGWPEGVEAQGGRAQPVVIHTPAEPPEPARTALFAVAESRLGVVVRDAANKLVNTQLWLRNPAFETVTSGTKFWLPPKYEAAKPNATPPTLPTVHYAMHLYTAAGAMQVRRAKHTLATSAPWATTTLLPMVQMGIPAQLDDLGGYTSSYEEHPGAPWQSIDQEALVALIGAGGKVYGPQLSVNKVQFTKLVKVIGREDNVPLIGDIGARLQRGVAVDMEEEQGAQQWAVVYTGIPLWGGDSIITFRDPGYPPDAGYPPEQYTSFWNGRIVPRQSDFYPGNTTGTASTQIGGKLRVRDDSYNYVTLTSGQIIFKSNVVRNTTHVECINNNYPATGPSWPIGYSEIGYYKHYPIEGLPYPEYYTIAPYVDKSIPDHAAPNRQELRTFLDRRSVSIAVNAEARDYLLFDEANSTYVFVDSKLTGTGADGTGYMTLSVRIALESPALQAASEVWDLMVSTSPEVNAILPRDINFGTSNRTWRYAAPVRPNPQFTPLWFDQGLCPFIAYTTVIEQQTALEIEPPFVPVFAKKPPPALPPPAPRLAASFRLQLLLKGRIPADFPQPTVEGALAVEVPMLEQMISLHFPGFYFPFFKAIEQQVFILNASAPGPQLHEDLNIDGSNWNSEFYRT